MKRPLVIAVSLLTLGAVGVLSNAALSPVGSQATATEVAASRTATFAVENMTCALCPVTVKSAMERVNGVRSVEIDFGARTATVVFDPAVTSIDAIAAASTNAGYPAAIKS
ncbi:MAG: cation transporter [Alphaproteobacteria bacterium]|jgi:mercuric ion binding protein|nr:cation transporter [Alphaproteobacteria bacterium]